MAETTDRPPRRRRASQKPQEADSGQSSTSEVKPPNRVPPGLQKKLETFFAGFALPFLAAGDTHCAEIMATRAPALAEAWAALAAESPAVRRAIEALMRGGTWGAAIGTTVATVIPIAAHHGAPIPDLITPIIMGGPTPPEADVVGGDEPVYEQPVTAPGVTPAPGPAAVSTPAPVNGTVPDPTNPATYPGNPDL